MGNITTFQLFTLFISAIGGAIALYGFKKSNDLKRMEWLTKLYEKYYQSNQYRQGRKLLEVDNREKLNAFIILNPPDEMFVDNFNEFLYFFEYISTLWQLGHLKLEEARMLFDNNLTSMATNQQLFPYLLKHNFVELIKLLEALKKAKGIGAV